MQNPFGGRIDQAPFFTVDMHPDASNEMRVGDYVCTVHSPPATASRYIGNIEVARELPPYQQVKVLDASKLREIPEAWQQAIAAGTPVYVMEARPDYGLWFDLRGNNQRHKYTSIVISAQGVNAIDGIPLESNRPQLVRHTRCPTHNTSFDRTGGKNHCHACGYDWPDQNYLSNANPDAFWRDGFRTPEGDNNAPGDRGKTRQFKFLREEQAHMGVAKQILGDKRGIGFGLIFFSSFRDRPRPPTYRGSHGGLESMESTRSFSPEIGAGALINQTVGRDELGPEGWDRSTARSMWLIPLSLEAIHELLAQQPQPSAGFMKARMVGHNPSGNG